jgi:hypothetical protein
MRDYRSFRLPYRLTRPPRAIRKARLDNIALVPASLLFHKPKYTAVANRLPTGSVLICTPTQPKQRKALAYVAAYLRSMRHQVTTLSATQLAT